MNDPAHDIPARTSGSSLATLVVDDEESDRLRLRRLCAQAGLDLEVTEAACLDEMNEKLRDTAFDLVFIDYHLGMETGQDALELLRRQEAQNDAIAIMVTSVDRHDVIIRAMRSGCEDYLIKEELSRDAIRKSVATAIERRVHARQQNADREGLDRLGKLVARLSDSFAPDMRAVLAGLLRHSRLETQVTDPRKVAQSRGMEVLCNRGFELLTDLQKDFILAGSGDPREGLPRPDSARLEDPS